MGTPTSIFQLRRKRNEIRDAIASYEVKLREARADLAAVLSTLRLFEVPGDPADLAPYMDLNRLFRRGETTELCLAALQEEGELDTRQLTARVMAAKGLDASDKVLFQAIALRVVQTLRVRAKRGKLIDGTTRRRGVCVWRLTSADGAANSPSTDATPDLLPPASRSQRIALRSLPGGDLRPTPLRRTR
jgi:hypothetical protein